MSFTLTGTDSDQQFFPSVLSFTKSYKMALLHSHHLLRALPVKVKFAPGIQVSGGNLPEVYDSLQFHVHWGKGSSVPGSEHTVDGVRSPMEVRHGCAFHTGHMAADNCWHTFFLTMCFASSTAAHCEHKVILEPEYNCCRCGF